MLLINKVFLQGAPSNPKPHPINPPATASKYSPIVNRRVLNILDAKAYRYIFINPHKTPTPRKYNSQLKKVKQILK